MPFFNTQNLPLSSASATSFDLALPPLNSVYIFFWSKSKILFCLNCSILCSYLLIFALFASILCFSSSITVFNPLLFTPPVSFIQFPQFTFFLQSQFSFWFPFQKVDLLFQPLYTPLNPTLPPWFICMVFLPSLFPVIVQQSTFIHITLASVSPILSSASFISSSPVPASISTVSASTLISCPSQSSSWIHLLVVFWLLLVQVRDSQPFIRIALAWSHTRCSVDSNIPLSLHSLNILCLYRLIGLPSPSNGLLL